MANVKNYVLLETITVGAAGASSVTFNNIPQTGYTDLKLVMSTRLTYSGNIYGKLKITFNGSASTYTTRQLYGDGQNTPASVTQTNTDMSLTAATAAETANTFGNTEIYIPNYTSSNQKSFSVDGVNETNAQNAVAELGAGLWNGTSAISSIKVEPGSNGGTFVQYSTFTLYGIAAVGTTPTVAPYAAGGDIIQTDGTYWYHAFLSSGTFTPAKALSADILVVAGGGGGGELGGGGGAGGLQAFTSQSLTATGYTVTVGGGGAGQAGANGVNGSNSQFSSLTASVGGGGGGRYDLPGSNGGSGGGGGRGNQGGGSGTSGQGYAGGGGSGTYAAGGGGGAGAVGTGATAGTGGAGGNGLNTYSSWASATSTGVSGYYAGGGGGGYYYAGGFGVGGSGGGGNGSETGVAGGNATANTGSGGGGNGGGGVAGGNGGSGIIIVRYAI